LTPDGRAEALLVDLLAVLEKAARLADRGRNALDEDEALPLAFEAICNRVGDIAKKLLEVEPARFTDSVWREAAQNRDFVVHQYHRIDLETLWITVSESLPALREKIPTV
jgi:uncharacterized protein with HEPN domain